MGGSGDQEPGQDQNHDQDQGQWVGTPALPITIMGVAEDSWGERRRRNPKRMGELSQAAFLLKAQSLGFGLAVPWGDSEKCDFIVWARPQGRLLRVQVKATGRFDRGGYDVQPVYSTRGEGKKTYTAEEIDVLAAHVILEVGERKAKPKAGSKAKSKAGDRSGGGTRDVWYLLPVEAIAGVKSLRFFPGLKGRDPKWEGYREAWEWLEGRQWPVVSGHFMMNRKK